MKKVEILLFILLRATKKKKKCKLNSSSLNLSHFKNKVDIGSKMAGVGATLTSSQAHLELQLNCKEIIQNNQLSTNWKEVL